MRDSLRNAVKYFKMKKTVRKNAQTILVSRTAVTFWILWKLKSTMSISYRGEHLISVSDKFVYKIVFGGAAIPLPHLLLTLSTFTCK